MNYQTDDLDNKIFFYKIDNDTKNYFQIKKKIFYRSHDEKVMLQFIDISKSILLDIEKTSNQVLEMINACVSHEMRNPLNSIIAQNLEKKYLYEELESKINVLDIDHHSPELILGCKEIVTQLKGGIRVQESSAQFLHFMV
jgi:light-regulated signal transduction histidine kinase (bacteriophytochrome)